jgi:hypothetical protein
MANVEKERRTQGRSYIEPYDTGTFLEFAPGDKKYRFNLLDTSPDGMGMLVFQKDAEVLENFEAGERVNLKYSVAETSLYMKFEIKHVTLIERGPFKGHYQIGISLVPQPE